MRGQKCANNMGSEFVTGQSVSPMKVLGTLVSQMRSGPVQKATSAVLKEGQISHCRQQEEAADPDQETEK